MGSRRRSHLVALVVRHDPGVEPYGVGRALAGAGLEVDLRCMDEGDCLPADTSSMAALVVLGGTGSAASSFPTLDAELALLGDALERQVPVLGICLGAQMLASVGGGRVFRGPSPEVCWGPVRTAPAAAAEDELFAEVPGEVPALVWHSDTFDVPPGATLLASTDRYPQAFRVGKRAWGVQFHLEVDAVGVRHWVDAYPDEAALAAGGGAGLLEAAPGMLATAEPVWSGLLDRFARLAVDRARGPQR